MTESGGTLLCRGGKVYIAGQTKNQKWESGEWGAENVAPGGIS
jgi:hypothetical protein